MSGWQPARYLDHVHERSRPARELLAQVPLVAPRRVYDLGCGPGNSTTLLVERFPAAEVAGIDNSPAMLAAARNACPQACFTWGDLAEWAPEETPDLLFSNATFHWVPDHLGAMERLAQLLPDGGVLAVQMPDNLTEPSHALMQKAAEEGPWAGRLAPAAAAREALPPPALYYTRLKPLFRQLDIWHTIYNHPLEGVDGVIAWLMSTGLRPYLDMLDVGERAAFLAHYRALLVEQYPLQTDGKLLLRFPRLFLVGVR